MLVHAREKILTNSRNPRPSANWKHTPLKQPCPTCVPQDADPFHFLSYLHTCSSADNTFKLLRVGLFSTARQVF